MARQRCVNTASSGEQFRVLCRCLAAVASLNFNVSDAERSVLLAVLSAAVAVLSAAVAVLSAAVAVLEVQRLQADVSVCRDV